MNQKRKERRRATDSGSETTPSRKAGTSSTDNPSKWIRIEGTFPLPVEIKDCIQRLHQADFLAYPVGGCVRDFLLQRPIKDYDLATDATPDEICELFPNAITVGKAFGVIRIPGGPEIATFRKDLEYRDGRHPVGVEFTGPEEDARRRDFTINGLFWDPKSQQILDVVDGVADLENKRVRAIGKPLERFREDALRLLRAVRFTTTLGFTLEEKTEAAIKTSANSIRKISSERVRDEFNQMLIGPAPDKALGLLSELGILSHVLPEISALKSVEPAWKHLLKLMGILATVAPKRSTNLGWAALLHDTGKPVAWKKSSGKSLSGHEILGAQVAKSVCQRMRLSHEEVGTIMTMVEEHFRFKDVFKMREATLLRWLRQPYFEDLLTLHQADAISTDGNLAYYEFCSSRLNEIRAAGPEEDFRLIDGDDLIQLGFSPGPRFTQILRTVEDLALEKKLQTKNEALEFVVKYFVS